MKNVTVLFLLMIFIFLFTIPAQAGLIEVNVEPGTTLEISQYFQTGDNSPMILHWDDVFVNQCWDSKAVLNYGINNHFLIKAGFTTSYDIENQHFGLYEPVTCNLGVRYEIVRNLAQAIDLSYSYGTGLCTSLESLAKLDICKNLSLSGALFYNFRQKYTTEIIWAGDGPNNWCWGTKAEINWKINPLYSVSSGYIYDLEKAPTFQFSGAATWKQAEFSITYFEYIDSTFYWEWKTYLGTIAAKVKYHF